MDRILKKNWVLAIISLAVALAVWALVTEQNDPIITRSFSGVTISQVGTPSGFAVRLNPSTLTVTIRGPQSVLSHMANGDISPVVHVPNNAKGSNLQLPVKVSVPRGVALVSASPSTVSVSLEQQETAARPVVLKPVGTVAFGYRMTQLHPGTTTAMVSGPAELVNQVAQVEGFVTLYNQSTSGQVTVQLEAVDKRGGTVTGVTVSPQSTTATIDVAQVPSKTLPVVVDMIGNPKSGYKLSEVTVDPSTVTVYGSSSVLASLSKIKTGPFSVVGATQSVIRAVAINLPKGTYSNVSDVKVHAIITKTPTSAHNTSGSSGAPSSTSQGGTSH